MYDASDAPTSRRCIIYMIGWLSTFQFGSEEIWFGRERQARRKGQGKKERGRGRRRRHETRRRPNGDGADGGGKQTENETHGDGRTNAKAGRDGRKRRQMVISYLR